MKSNFYNRMDWDSMLHKYPCAESEEGKQRVFDVNKYYKILCSDFPEFLEEYTSVPSMQRLKGIGLLCGTDWTPLYKNRFYYSRFDHSVGVALIVWNFTHDRTQTLAGLFHDIATPIFSHVAEFRKGDALTQTDSESGTRDAICGDKHLCELLFRDGICVEKVCDYHLYPVADNERPQLSADRLEYMFPSGAALQGSWSLQEIAAVYGDIRVLKNESGTDELGFLTAETAEIYCEKFLETGHILQLNENKLALQLLAEITSEAVCLGIISEKDCFLLSEKAVVEKFDSFCERRRRNSVFDGVVPAEDGSWKFVHLYRTFRNMTSIVHSDMSCNDCFCVNIDVKQRYINPLVRTGRKTARLSDVSSRAGKLIEEFLSYKDFPFGCVKIV